MENTGGWQTPDVNFANVTVSGEFMAVSPNGAEVDIFANATSAEIDLQPPNSATPGVTFSPARIFATSTGDNPLLDILGPFMLTPVLGGAGEIFLGADSVLSQTVGQLLAQQVVIGDPSAGSTVQIESVINWGATTPSVTVDSFDTGGVTTGTTLSAAFTNSLTTTGVRGVAFVVPPSGNVYVDVCTGGFNNVAGSFTLVDFEVRAGAVVGAGAVLRASDENTASQFNSAVANQAGQHKVSGKVSGLTPGATCNACITYRVTGNTGSFNRRKILVMPVM